jgi:hypothetical protein
LGASYPERGGLCPPRRILLHQSGEACIGVGGARLAAFVISPRRARRYFSGRLGGRRSCKRRVWREMKMRPRMEFGAAKAKMADYADANRALHAKLVGRIVIRH